MFTNQFMSQDRPIYKCIIPHSKTPTASKQTHTPFDFPILYSYTLYSLSKSIRDSTSMAFTSLPSIRNSISWPAMLLHDISESDNNISLRNKGIYKGQRNLRDLTVANVASPSLPVIVPPPPEERSGTTGGRHHHHHVAWTSIPQERWEGELKVQGQIPLWLKGTYLRNGPGIWHIGDYKFRHLFDGYATLVKLQFENGRLVGGHRQVESEAYRELFEVPKAANFLAYVGELASLFSGASLTDNVNTGVVKLDDGRVVCLTETQKGFIVIC